MKVTDARRRYDRRSFIKSIMERNAPTRKTRRGNSRPRST